MPATFTDFIALLQKDENLAIRKLFDNNYIQSVLSSISVKQFIAHVKSNEQLFANVLAHDIFKNFFLSHANINDLIDLVSNSSEVIKIFISSSEFYNFFIKHATIEQTLSFIKMGGETAEVFVIPEQIQKFIADNINIEQLIELLSYEKATGKRLLNLDRLSETLTDGINAKIGDKVKGLPKEFINLTLHEFRKKLFHYPLDKSQLAEYKNNFLRGLDEINLLWQITLKSLEFLNVYAKENNKPLEFSTKISAASYETLIRDIKRNLSFIANNLSPVSLLEFQNSICDFFNYFANKYNLTSLILTINQFIKGDTKLYFSRIDRLSAGFELFMHIIKPSILHQGHNANICGVATLLTSLLHHMPAKFLEMVIQNAENGKVEKPFKIMANTSLRDGEVSIIAALMHALRHSYNKTGYHPSSLFEKIKGATLPKELADFLIKCGFKNISEFTLLIDSNNREISVLQQNILNTYTSHHESYPNKIDYLTALSNQLENNNFGIILISRELTNALLKNDIVIDISPEDTLAGIVTRHWVYVDKLILNEETETLDLAIETYGKYLSFHNIPINYFLKNYYGGICALLPTLNYQNNVELSLQSTPTQP